jgi:hypothetical protein
MSKVEVNMDAFKANVGKAGASMGAVRAKPETIEENMGMVSDLNSAGVSARKIELIPGFSG